MGTLMKVRLSMKKDKDIRKMMVRGSLNEILLDINGDKEAEVALQDINHDGNIDRIAFDITEDGWFDLFIDDNDMNGIPDRIFVVKQGDEETPDKVEELAAGPEVKDAIIDASAHLMAILDMQELVREDLEVGLAELERNVRKLRRAIR